MTTIKNCEKCQIPLHRLESREIYSYYIGDHCIEVIAHVSKGECPRCFCHWESPDARQKRSDAFRKAIDDFWKNQLDTIGVKDTEMASVMFVVSRLMLNIGQEKSRQVAAELGRWLADCAFLN